MEVDDWLPLSLFDTDETMQMVIGYRWQPLACPQRADSGPIVSSSLAGSRREAEMKQFPGMSG
jgi:hypothetical protein